MSRVWNVKRFVTGPIIHNYIIFTIDLQQNDFEIYDWAVVWSVASVGDEYTYNFITP